MIYQNPTYGINIQFPSTWTIDENESSPANDNVADVAFFESPFLSYSNKYAEALAVRIDSLQLLNVSLDTYLNDTINAYSDTKDFKVVDSDTNSSLVGNPAYKLVYTFTETLEDEGDNGRDNDVAVKVMEIGTIIGKKVYKLPIFFRTRKV